MKKILEYVERLPDRSKVIGCLLLSLLLGVADYITGDFSLSLFYFLPIAFASWFIGKRAGFFISMLCSAELFIADQLVAPAYVSVVSIRSWNALMEVCFLLLTGYLLSKVRDETEHTRLKSIELEDANRGSPGGVRLHGCPRPAQAADSYQWLLPVDQENVWRQT